VALGVHPAGHSPPGREHRRRGAHNPVLLRPGLGVKIVMKIARLLSLRLRKTSGLLVDYLEN